MIVADTNLVAYLLLGGTEAPAAQRVLERDPAWAAPLLWRSEFRSVLASFIRQRHLGLMEARRAHEMAEELFAGREFTVHGGDVLQLVATSPCSSYDCEYVALAQDLGTPLVTADKQLLRAFPDIAISPKSFGGR